MREQSKLNQSSKSTSSKKMRRKRDISPVRPHSEFPATTSTFSGLAILFSLFLGFLGVSNTYASSISISLTGNVSLNLLKDNANPVFGTSTTTTANVTSDHYTGYTLTIQGANDSGKLENGDGSKYLTSIGDAINESTFRTNDSYNDQWGFLPSKYNSADNNIYQPSPLHTNSTTIDVTNSPTSNNGNTYTLALGAKVTPSMALDSYGQTFVLAATGNGYDYHIGYSDVMETLPADQYGNTQSNTVTLSTSVPTKSGYTFGGWCSEVPTASLNGTTCPSGAAVYQPGATITLDGATGNDMELYAIWARGYDTFDAAFAAAGKSKSGGYYQMQDMNSDICTSIIVGTLGTLVDTRNTTTYEVAKYADGHCWMRQNLSLSLTANTDVVAYDFNTGNIFNYRPTFTTQTSAGTIWAENGSDGARSYGGDKDKYIGGMDINTSGGTGATTGQPYEKIGIIYNWTAATAQTGAQAAAATNEVSTSICPKGWRLPANDGDYSFSILMGSYGLPAARQLQGYSGQLQNPLNFNRPGYYGYEDGIRRDIGAVGAFWSAKVYGLDSTYVHYFTFWNERFYPQHTNKRGTGFSVRCVAV